MIGSGPTLPPGKAAPEALALRGRPARAIRFRRNVVIAIAVGGALALTLIAWFAFRPALLPRPAPETMSTLDAPPDGALEQLPATYGDVPKLGPPLPGDLGRPILAHQRGDDLHDRNVDAAAAARAAERDREAAEQRAAASAPVIVLHTSDGSSGGFAGALQPASEPPLDAPDRPRLAIDPLRDPNGQQRKADFMAAPWRDGSINPHRTIAPPSRHILSAGSVIAASLLTGLRSDLPGLVTAHVTSPVYDSPTGQILLVPQGARLIGDYDSVVAHGQRRALVVWRRIIFPDGASLTLDNAPASDPAGYAGLEDKVDNHGWSLLKGAAIATLLGVGSELALSGESDLIDAVRRSTQDSATRAGDRLVQRNLDVQPTITVRPGAPVRLLVTKDLVLPPWKA